MSVNIRESGSLVNVERKVPKAFAQFNTDEFTLNPSDKKLSLNSSITAKLSKVDDSADWLKHADNIYDKSLITNNGFAESNGNITVDLNWKYGYIPIEGGKSYRVTHDGNIYVTANCLWVDSSKNFISVAFNRSADSPTIISAPTNASYLLLSLVNNIGTYTELDSCTVTRYSMSNDELTETLSTYSNPNLLDNPFFTFNSKGQTTYSGAIACVDRWQSWESSNITTINTNGTVSVSRQIAQALNDNGKGIKGKTITLSIMLENGEVKHTTSNIENNPISSVIANITVIADVYCILYADAIGNITAQFNNTSGSAITIKAIKLEYGTVSTLANDNSNVEGYTSYTITNELSTKVHTFAFQNGCSEYGKSKIISDSKAYYITITTKFNSTTNSIDIIKINDWNETENIYVPAVGYKDGSGWGIVGACTIFSTGVVNFGSGTSAQYCTCTACIPR